MRIITGTARGIRLETLEGDAVRPTTEKTKEALFSAIQFDIEGRRVLDLFAGSGQLGLEALSRGAARAVFTDNSDDALGVIRRNIQKAGFDRTAVVCKTDYEQYLKFTKDTFDIVIIDPPYNSGFYDTAIALAAKHTSDYGMIICEHPSDVTLPESANGFTVFRSYRYGKLVNVTIYKKSSEG